MSEENHEAIVMAEMYRERLTDEAPPLCGQGLAGTTFRCVMDAGHEGPHGFDKEVP